MKAKRLVEYLPASIICSIWKLRYFINLRRYYPCKDKIKHWCSPEATSIRSSARTATKPSESTPTTTRSTTSAESLELNLISTTSDNSG